MAFVVLPHRTKGLTRTAHCMSMRFTCNSASPTPLCESLRYIRLRACTVAFTFTFGKFGAISISSVVANALTHFNETLNISGSASATSLLSWYLPKLAASWLPSDIRSLKYFLPGIFTRSLPHQTVKWPTSIVCAVARVPLLRCQHERATPCDCVQQPLFRHPAVL